MSDQDRAAERAAAVADAMDDIAKIDAHGREHGGIDRAGLERIKERLSTATAWPSNDSRAACSGTPEATSGGSTTTSAT